MAKLLRRLGTIAEKHLVKIFIHSIEIGIRPGTALTIHWKKSGGRISAGVKPSTTGTIVTSGETRLIEVNEEISEISTMYKKHNGPYIKKRLRFEVIAMHDQKPHAIGRFDISLQDLSVLPLENEFIPIKSPEDKHAQICVSVSLGTTDSGIDTFRDDESLIEKNEGLLDQIVAFIADLDVERFASPLNIADITAHLNPEVEGCSEMIQWKEKAQKRKAKLNMQRELNKKLEEDAETVSKEQQGKIERLEAELRTTKQTLELTEKMLAVHQVQHQGTGLESDIARLDESLNGLLKKFT